MHDNRLPYGTEDLDPRIQKNPATGQMRCFVRGCSRWLTPPTRQKGSGQPCPEHGIFCHTSGTYSYQDVRRNIIADPDALAAEIVGHPGKFEGGRLQLERSEDAVSWNVFRSFQNAGLLHEVASAMVGVARPDEPDLYLWGIRMTGRGFPTWDLLAAARRFFEASLPVDRPLTEPDIALHLPGRYLILIEAKFTSPNGTYVRGPRRSKADLTLDELLTIYRAPSLRILDSQEANRRGRVHYQLWRNTVFAEWMAGQDAPSTEAYHVNLVREGFEHEAAEEFGGLVRPEFRNRFQQATWEGLHSIARRHPASLGLLCRYMATYMATRAVKN